MIKQGTVWFTESEKSLGLRRAWSGVYCTQHADLSAGGGSCLGVDGYWLIRVVVADGGSGRGDFLK